MGPVWSHNPCFCGWLISPSIETCAGFTRAVVHGRISLVQDRVILHSVYALGHRWCRESCCGVRSAVTSLKFRGFGYLLGSLAGLYDVLYFLMLFSIRSVLDCVLHFYQYIRVSLSLVCMSTFCFLGLLVCFFDICGK